MQRQKGGMILDGAISGNIQAGRGHEGGDKGHHAEIGFERRHLLMNSRIPKGFGLEQGNAQLFGGEPQGIGFAARFVRRAINSDHRLAAFHQSPQDGFAKSLLSVHNQSHFQSLLRSTRFARS